MKKIPLILFFSIGNFIGISQQIFTIRLLDSESNQPVKEAKITFNGKHVTSNYLGYVQVEMNSGDTLTIEHNEYETALISLPTDNSLQAKLTRREVDLKCIWSAINFVSGDYYYSPIKINQPTIEDYYAYLILSKNKKAFFVVNSNSSMITSHKLIKLGTETFAIDLFTTESIKKGFQVLPDKIRPGQYFTIAQKEKEGVYFNLFEISIGQIDQLRNQMIKTIKLGNELVFDLDDLTARKIGKMFDCVE